jgi:hypothetical protein
MALDECKAVITQMDDDKLWDSVHARDIPPKIIEFVTQKLEAGSTAGEIARDLRLPGGKNSKQWKKIQSYFRQGFRADAEAFLYQKTTEYYHMLVKYKEILLDAIENGTPHVVSDGVGPTEVIRVKGATKELAAMIKIYNESISAPVKLWKDFGAIGEKKDVGTSGVNIQVINNIPMPSSEEIRKHQEEIAAKQQAIEVKSGQT